MNEQPVTLIDILQFVAIVAIVTWINPNWPHDFALWLVEAGKWLEVATRWEPH